ncbi:MAG: hypothetical protein K2X90_00255 [Candidatus Babeliaceae bacterium]|nr:hypothetical protein [Candidatus Babeliaceae bacterium]
MIAGLWRVIFNMQMELKDIGIIHIQGKRYQAIGIIKDWIEEHGETK